MTVLCAFEDSRNNGHYDRFRRMTGQSISVILRVFMLTVDWSLMIGHSRRFFFTHRNIGQAVIQSPIPPLGGWCNDDRMTSCSGRWVVLVFCHPDKQTNERNNGGAL
jgi:hypothetical protein